LREERRGEERRGEERRIAKRKYSCKMRVLSSLGLLK
jgi:hypothetical protein